MDKETESKYGRGDTPTRLLKRWKESQEEIKAARSGESCDRLVALQKFKELFAKNKMSIALNDLKNPYE